MRLRARPFRRLGILLFGTLTAIAQEKPVQLSQTQDSTPPISTPQTAPDPKLSQRPAEPLPLKQRPTNPIPDARRRIDLDVLVTDPSGKPVANLEPSDFTIFDNQVRQKLLTFRRAELATAEAKLSSEPLPEVIFVLDSASVSYQDMLFNRQDLEKFLRLNDGNLVFPTSIILVNDINMKVQPQPTRSGNALIRELENNQNALHALRRSAGGAAEAEKVQLCLRSLSQLAAYEYSRPGRKIVIWIGPGWSSLARNDADMNDKDRRRIFDTIILLSTRLREARITLYSVDNAGAVYYQAFLKPVTTAQKALSPNLMVQVLATQSGGRFVDVRSDLVAGIESILTDLTAYYTLSFNSPPTTRTDEYHAIEVRTSKPGLIVHTNYGYYNQP